jgi:hypothetical protein
MVGIADLLGANEAQADLLRSEIEAACVAKASF